MISISLLLPLRILSTVASSLTSFFCSSSELLFLMLPLLLFLCLPPRLKKLFTAELIGAALLVLLTSPAGVWFATDSSSAEFLAHVLGLISADYFSASADANPAVSVSMFMLSKTSFSVLMVKVVGQITGGYTAFRSSAAFAHLFSLPPLPGPAIPAKASPELFEDCFIDEFFSTFFLLIAIYVLNWVLTFDRKDARVNYVIKKVR